MNLSPLNLLMTPVPSLAADVSVEHGRGEWKTYGDITTYKPGHFQIKTYNKISPHGLARFPKENYEVKEG